MEKELLNTKIVREILGGITSGRFRHGRRLPGERALCEEFSVCRGTVRQALADLEKLGAIEIRPRSGAYIKKFSSRRIPKTILPPQFRNVSIEDIIFARKAIELAAYEKACQNADEKTLNYLSGLVEQMQASVNDLPVFLRLDMEFHESIIRAGENDVLVTAFEAISEYHKYSQVFSSLHEGEEDRALSFHRRMLNALKKRNASYGTRVLREHLDDILKSVNGQT